MTTNSVSVVLLSRLFLNLRSENEKAVRGGLSVTATRIPSELRFVTDGATGDYEAQTQTAVDIREN